MGAVWGIWSSTQWLCSQKESFCTGSSAAVLLHSRVWAAVVWPAGIALSLVTKKVALLAWQQGTCVRSARSQSAALWTGENRFTFLYLAFQQHDDELLGLLTCWGFAWFSLFNVFNRDLSKFSDVLFRLDADEGVMGLSTHLTNLSRLMEDRQDRWEQWHERSYYIAGRWW